MQNIDKNKPKRNSSFEILRIVAMIMILFHHFALFSEFNWGGGNELILSHFWNNLILMGGKIGTNCFMLISGYYLSASPDSTVHLKKILKYWGQVFFYSVLFYFAFALNGLAKVEIDLIIRAFLPITFSSWWYASTYFILYLLHPYLNCLIYHMSKGQYKSLLIILIICWSIIPTLAESTFESNNLLWFMVLYGVAGYIRIYGFDVRFTKKHYFYFFILFSFITYLFNLLFTIAGLKWGLLIPYAMCIYGQESIFIFLSSFALFMAFKSMTMNYHHWINCIASTVFGVYLIHCNEYFYPILWKQMIKGAQYQNSVVIIPYSIIAVILVFLCCSVVEWIRIKTIEKVYMALIERLLDK